MIASRSSGAANYQYIPLIEKLFDGGQAVSLIATRANKHDGTSGLAQYSMLECMCS